MCVGPSLLNGMVYRFIGARLDDYNDLRRKKKHCPSSASDVWKLNNRLRKENIFLEPLMPGEFVSSLNCFATITCFSVKELFSHLVIGACVCLYIYICRVVCRSM